MLCWFVRCCVVSFLSQLLQQILTSTSHPHSVLKRLPNRCASIHDGPLGLVKCSFGIWDGVLANVLKMIIHHPNLSFYAPSCNDVCETTEEALFSWGRSEESYVRSDQQTRTVSGGALHHNRREKFVCRFSVVALLCLM